MGGRRGPAVESMKEWDVIVVGGGNAAFCASLAAREAGACAFLPKDEFELLTAMLFPQMNPTQHSSINPKQSNL